MPDEHEGDIPYIKSEPFKPIWQGKTFSRSLQRWIIPIGSLLLSAVSALYAWKAYDATQSESLPKVAITSITLANTQVPASFEKTQLALDYRNIGGSAEGGVRLVIKQVSVGSPSPIIAAGDDGSFFMKGDNKKFTFPAVRVGGANTALLACFYVFNKSEVLEQEFSFAFPDWTAPQSISVTNFIDPDSATAAAIRSQHLCETKL